MNQKTQSATRWSNNEGQESSTNYLARVLFGQCAHEDEGGGGLGLEEEEEEGGTAVGGIIAATADREV